MVGGGVLYVHRRGLLPLRGVDGLGMGDVKMLAMIGAFLGWRLMLVTLVLRVVRRRRSRAWPCCRRGAAAMKAALPFGTFLAVGAAGRPPVGGDPLIDWYLGFYR